MAKSSSKPNEVEATAKPVSTSRDRLTKAFGDNRVAGVSGSTGLIGLIHAMKVPDPAAAVLVFLSPAATVIGIELYRFGSRQLFRWLSQREQQAEQRRIDKEKAERLRKLESMEDLVKETRIPEADKQRMLEDLAKRRTALVAQNIREVLQSAEPATPSADRSSDPVRSVKVDQSASPIEGDRGASQATA